MRYVYAIETDHGLLVGEVQDPSPATLEEAEARNLSRLLRLVTRFPDTRIEDLLTEADVVFMGQMADRAEALVPIQPKEPGHALPE